MTSPITRRAVLGAALASGVVAGARPARAEISEVRIGLQFGFIYLPITVADTQGFIAKRAQELGIGPLTVTLRRFSGTPAMNDAMLSGNVDLGAVGLPGMLIAWEKTRGHFGMKGLAAMPLNAFFMYSNKPSLKTFADLKPDDRVAVPAPNAGQGILLRMAMEKIYGPGEYKRADAMMVSLPHPDAVSALLAGGTISAYFATSPYTQMLAHDSRVHLIGTSKEILGSEVSGAILSCSQKFFDDNPKVAQAVFQGIDDAMHFIIDDPHRAAEIYLKSEPTNLSVDAAAAMLHDGSNTFQVAPGGTMALATFMARTGMLHAAPTSWKEPYFPILQDQPGS